MADSPTWGNLEMIQRSLVWLGIAVVVLVVTFVSVARLLGRVNDDRSPTIVGAFALVKGGHRFSSPPLFAYVGDVYTKSGVLSMMATTGAQDVVARILFSNIVQGGCAIDGASIIG